MNTTESSLYVPPDAQEAYDAFGATCGPNALAAILGRPVMSLREALQPYAGYTTFAGMLRTLRQIGAEHAVIRENFVLIPVPYDPCKWTGRLSLVQFCGSWMNPGVHPGAALARTHWVAYEHSHRMVYDVNAGPTGDGGWLPQSEWVATILSALMADKKGCTGWSVRGTILVNR